MIPSHDPLQITEITPCDGTRWTSNKYYAVLLIHCRMLNLVYVAFKYGMVYGEVRWLEWSEISQKASRRPTFG